MLSALPDGSLAHLDAALVQQVLNVPEGEGKADIQHNGQMDVLGAGAEVPEGAVLAHPARVAGPLPGSSHIILTAPRAAFNDKVPQQRNPNCHRAGNTTAHK